MGSCSSLFKRRAAGDEIWAFEGRSPKSGYHKQVCEASDFLEASSIRQAFKTSAGGRKDLPRKLDCSACGRFIVDFGKEAKFHSCSSCWQMGLVNAVCADCYLANRLGLNDLSPEMLQPDDPPPETKQSSSFLGPPAVSMVVPPPLPHEVSSPDSDSEIDLTEEVGATKPKRRPSSARRASSARRPSTLARRNSRSSEAPSPVEKNDKKPPHRTETSSTIAPGESRRSSQASKGALPWGESSVSSIPKTRRMSTQSSMRSQATTEGESAPRPRRTSSQMSLKSAETVTVAAPKRAAKQLSGLKDDPSPKPPTGRRRSVSEAKKVAKQKSRRMSTPPAFDHVEKEDESPEPAEPAHPLSQSMAMLNRKEKTSRPEPVVPSGLWIANFTEGKKRHQRREERILHFDDGVITGSGSFDCTVQGRYKLPSMQWKETYTWGTITVTATFGKPPKVAETNIEGTFSTSDGGQGNIRLIPQESALE